MSITLAASAVVLGFVHGLGADHLMAIAALSVKPGQTVRRARVMRTAVGFAVGHTVLLGLGACAAVLFGLVLPAAIESGAEKVGGSLLVVLGVLGLWGIVSGRAYAHLHPETDGRTRWHFHLGGGAHPHAHPRLPALMGAVFAVSGLRALMLLEPFGARAASLTLPVLLLLNVLFGLGILASMSLFGVVLARVLSLGAVDTLSRVAAIVVALGSMLLGVFWMIS
jgi:hypothetical protein